MTSTAVSWALTLALVGVGVYYYKPDLLTSLTSSSSATSLSQPEPVERPANKRTKSKKSQLSKVVGGKNDSAPSSSNEAQSGKKRKIVTGAADNVTAARQSSDAETIKDSDRKAETDLADRDFAQQLAKTQAGTKLQKSEGQSSTKKNKAPKQPQGVKVDSSDFSTETSSTAGRDADDDFTPADSPLVQASAGPSRAGDISDMLEAPAAKPTTLRLTGISDESTPKKKPANQPFEKVLTKKQRQNQAKREELRLMREESDRIHEAKKQEQLRKARMAAGTSNQTKANNFANSNKPNAWLSNGASEAVKVPPAGSPAPLLDTFEPHSNNVSQPQGAVHTKRLTPVNATDATELRQEIGARETRAVAASTREGALQQEYALAGNISEEEQIQRLKEQQAEDAWESVTSKKSKKKTRNDGSEGPGITNPSATVVKAQTNGTKTSPPQIRPEPDTNNRFGSFQTQQSASLADAEWEA